MDKVKKKIKNISTNMFKYIALGLGWTIVILAWILFIGFWMLWIVFPYAIIGYIFIPLIIILYIKLMKYKFYGYMGNVILFGGKGSGKSLTQQYLIYNEKTKPLGNIDFGYNDIVSPKEYYESIAPNNSRSMINNTLTQVEKNESWEGRNYHFDDTNMFAPNTEDSYLKTYYKAMSLFILGQRHFYNSYTVMNAQSLERMYKNLRELQLDGYIKALKNNGFGWFWRKLPILKKYVRIKVRYYSQYESALHGKLPFEKLGILNRGVGLAYTTTPESIKMQYEAENGIIRDFALWLKKDKIKYDTREYHKWLFGKPAPTKTKKRKNKNK